MQKINLVLVVLATIAASSACKKEEESRSRNAAQIAVETDVGAGKFVDYLKALEVDSLEFRSPRSSWFDLNCPLLNPGKGLNEAEVDALPREGTSHSLCFTGFDRLFERYGNCLQVNDWRVLKALAKVESGLNPEAENMFGFVGLFQTKERFCRAALAGYDADMLCVDLKNPEVSTMAETSQLMQALRIIEDKCPNAGSDTIAYFMYVGHANGAGTLSQLLNRTCDSRLACRELFDIWNAQEGYHSDLSAETVCDTK